jgi:phosphinothricin acetyltransferase
VVYVTLDHEEFMPIIRLATEHDAKQIHAIYAPIVRDTIISFELEIPAVDEMKQRICATLEQYPWLVCDNDSEVMGYAYASAHRSRKAYQWSVDVSAYTHEIYRRQGVGRALYTALFEILRHQGYFNAYAGIALPNAGSIGLHEAMGFQPVGVYKSVGYKFGGWHDVSWHQLTLQPHTDSVQAPTSIRALKDTPILYEILSRR